MSTLRPARLVAVATLVIVAGAACAGSDGPRTPAADAISLGSTSSTMSSEDPPVVIGGAPGPDGHLPVRLNPAAWKNVATSFVDDDPRDPYHELHSDGHDDFWWGVELHLEEGPGWTGELGLFSTDCVGAGICVRFDPDGGAGPTGPLLSDPNGEAAIDRIDGGYSLTFRNLVFRRDDGVSYRVDVLTVEA